MTNNLAVLRVYAFDKKKRLGIQKDGGYVIGEIDENYDCYISAGVANEESFTRDFLNLNKLNKTDCYAFDGTIKDYPYEYTENITFNKKNISDKCSKSHDNLLSLIDKYDGIFLKMDIEGGEYPWIKNLKQEHLEKFKQIVIEFHGIFDDSWNCSYSDKIECFKKMNKTHYIIHAHGNNCGRINNNGIPETIELTYLNKKLFRNLPEFNKQNLPIFNLDFPNNPNKKDINLSFQPFLSGLNVNFEKINHRRKRFGIIF
jgi:hypothetical protein